MHHQQELLITNGNLSREEPRINFKALPVKTKQAIQRYLRSCRDQISTLGLDGSLSSIPDVQDGPIRSLESDVLVWALPDSPENR